MPQIQIIRRPNDVEYGYGLASLVVEQDTPAALILGRLLLNIGPDGDLQLAALRDLMVLLADARVVQVIERGA
jgi:hypothetical protein